MDMLHCSDGYPYAERSYITIDIRLHEWGVRLHDVRDET